MHSKAREDPKAQNDPHQIEFVECARFKHISKDDASI